MSHTPMKTNESTPEPSRSGATHGPRTLPLYLSAAVLAGLVLLQFPIWPEAKAEMTQKSGTYSAMTTDGGSREILVVVNDRTEEIMVYGVEPGNNVVLYQRESLARLFSDAKASFLGRP